MNGNPLLRGARFAALLCVPLALVHAARAPDPQQDATSRSWNQPVPPFRILGNLYYVGANEITSFLIVTTAGDILLDGGFEETAPQIEANIRKLGFHLSEVKILLNSHAHLDHAGGLAELKRATGAALYASVADAPMLESGGHGDFFFGDRLTFPPVKPDRLLRDGDAVRLGGMELTAHLTAGHTKGCTTWTATLEENGARYHAVFVCSTSVVSGYRLVGNAAYPDIAEDYANTFRTLRSLPCDVFLGSHGSFFGLTEKREALAAGAPSNPFLNPGQYRTFLDRSEAAFREELRRQQELAKTHPSE
jgi:metallo-beta-lactamase class B